MHATKTRKFQELHLRHVRGESLSEMEQTFYQNTLAALDREETAEIRAAQERGIQLRAQLSGLSQTPHARPI